MYLVCFMPVSVCFCVLQSMVQVETLGELGVFFTLFVVGLEFSPERLRKVSEKDSNATVSLVCFSSCTRLFMKVKSH